MNLKSWHCLPNKALETFHRVFSETDNLTNHESFPLLHSRRVYRAWVCMCYVLCVFVYFSISSVKTWLRIKSGRNKIFVCLQNIWIILCFQHVIPEFLFYNMKYIKMHNMFNSNELWVARKKNYTFFSNVQKKKQTKNW